MKNETNYLALALAVFNRPFSANKAKQKLAKNEIKNIKYPRIKGAK